jgi:hypothetical protein
MLAVRMVRYDKWIVSLGSHDRKYSNITRYGP